MKFAFFGTPDFAAVILQKLIDAKMPPALVVCNPDRPQGRKKIITPPPTKIIAEKNHIPVWQPESLEIGNWKSEIDKIGGVNFCVIAAYSKIIPKTILDTPPGKFIGVHPSLLPRWRGTTPIQNAILAGDKVTGVSLFLTDEKIDHGPILAGREFSISNFQFSILQRKLAELGADLLIENLPKFLRGEIKTQIQNEDYATYTKKFTAEDAYVDLAKDEPALIEKKVRALNPEPGVWTTQNGKRMKILEAELTGSQLKLKKIQWEGKTPQIL